MAGSQLPLKRLTVSKKTDQFPGLFSLWFAGKDLAMRIPAGSNWAFYGHFIPWYLGWQHQTNFCGSMWTTCMQRYVDNGTWVMLCLIWSFGEKTLPPLRNPLTHLLLTALSVSVYQIYTSKLWNVTSPVTQTAMCLSWQWRIAMKKKKLACVFI